MYCDGGGAHASDREVEAASSDSNVSEGGRDIDARSESSDCVDDAGADADPHADAPGDDQGDGAGGGAVNDGPPLSGPVPRGGHVVYFEVPCGQIRYYVKTRRLVAHCHHAGHGHCRKEKLAFEGARPGQGRPLGVIMAFLAAANDYEDHDIHLAVFTVVSFEDRVAGRNLLKGVAGSEVLFQYERKQRPGEGEEPEDCPCRGETRLLHNTRLQICVS